MGKRYYVILLALLSATCKAQYLDHMEVLSPRVEQAIENSKELEVTFSLDHKVYFPGEIVNSVIKVRNPGILTLEVLEPFRALTGGVDIIQYDKKLQTFVGMNAHSSSSEPTSDSPLTVIRPEQVLENKTSSIECKYFDGRAGFMPGCTAPMEPGRYKLIYTYNGASVEFEVVRPKVEQTAIVHLHRAEKAVSETGVPSDKLVAVVVASQTRRAILISEAAQEVGVFEHHPITDHELPYLSPLRCIADLDSPIKDLSIKIDDKNHIVAHWETRNGTSSQAEFDHKTPVELAEPK